jgi:predicted alpha/beta superfamily hydrolase
MTMSAGRRARPRRDERMRVLSRVRSSQNVRDVDIYLPPSYSRTRRRYPVVYMQDAQNLADPARAFAGTWELHQAIERLAANNIEAIIVGVPHLGARRIHEYSPFPDPRHGGGEGNSYVAFLERTVKPLVDRRFRTRSERDATAIFGSSMGALISLYAFFKAPATFGLTGAMSPSLWFAGRGLLDYIENDGAPPGRIYLDVGTEEGAGTLRDARHLAAMLRRKGYREGESLVFTEDPGGRHQEAHWGRRLVPALKFLLAPFAFRPARR